MLNAIHGSVSFHFMPQIHVVLLGYAVMRSAYLSSFVSSSRLQMSGQTPTSIWHWAEHSGVIVIVKLCAFTMYAYGVQNLWLSSSLPSHHSCCSVPHLSLLPNTALSSSSEITNSGVVNPEVANAGVYGAMEGRAGTVANCSMVPCSSAPTDGC